MLHTYFLKRLRQYTLLLMIPILILLAGILILYPSSVIRSIRQESADSMIRIEESVDTIISDTVYQHDLMTNNPQLALSLRKLLGTEETDYNYYVLTNSITGLIRSVTNAHPYIMSTYLQLDGYGRFFSSRDGVSNIETYYDRSWLDDAKESDLEKLIGRRRMIAEYSYASPVEVLSIYQRMTTLKGTIVVNLYYKNFLDKLSALRTQDEEEFFVFDTRGELLIATPEEPGRSCENPRFLEELSGAVTGNAGPLSASFLKLDGKYYWVSSLPDKTSDFIYASVLPGSLLLQEMRSTLLVFALLTLLSFAVVYTIARKVTKDSFDHIEQVISLFSDAEKGIYPKDEPRQASDEYDLILMNVIRMFLRTSFLDQQLELHKYQQEAAELQALQLQISPHFTSNTLQTLDFEVRRQLGKPTIINRIIKDLSDILRYSLGSPREMVMLEDEINTLKKYIEIQKVRFGDRITFYLEIDDDVLSTPVPRLILQPLIENSIAHGVSQMQAGGFIKIRVFRRGDVLRFSVTDNGVGIEPEKLRELKENLSAPSGRHVGLANVNRRLVLTYGDSAALKIMSKQGWGCAIVFRIPAGSR